MTLHILNGDATRPEFEAAAIAGDILVWREALVEGPAPYPALSKDWFAAREQFLIEEFEAPEEKVQQTHAEFRQLLALDDYEEVVLWFEFDLFCQINMLAVLSALREHFQGQVSLVCPGDHAEIEDFRGLGQLSARHFGPLFEERLTLTPAELVFADQVYQAYTNHDPRLLKKIVENDIPAAFPHLQKALQLHLERFPQVSNGLSREEEEVLQALDGGLPSRFKWVGKVLRNDAGRGYGDLQYFRLVERLTPLFEETDTSVRLGEKGQKVLAGKAQFQTPSRPIGGADSRTWFWEAGELVQI